jgi:hypothetical protein
MSTSAGKVTVTAEFPHQLARQARVAAALQGTSRSQLIRQAVSEYILQTAVAGLLGPGADREESPSEKGGRE